MKMIKIQVAFTEEEYASLRKLAEHSSMTAEEYILYDIRCTTNFMQLMNKPKNRRIRIDTPADLTPADAAPSTTYSIFNSIFGK